LPSPSSTNNKQNGKNNCTKVSLESAMNQKEKPEKEATQKVLTGNLIPFSVREVIQALKNVSQSNKS